MVRLRRVAVVCGWLRCGTGEGFLASGDVTDLAEGFGGLMAADRGGELGAGGLAGSDAMSLSSCLCQLIYV